MITDMGNEVLMVRPSDFAMLVCNDMIRFFKIDGTRFETIQTIYKQIIGVCPSLTTCQFAVACRAKCNEVGSVHSILFYDYKLPMFIRFDSFNRLQHYRRPPD